jgi:hypothetical protein
MKRNTTTYESALKLFKNSFETHPYWILFDGMETKGTRIATSNESLILKGVEANIETIEQVISNFENGVMTLVCRSNMKATADQVIFTFTKGDVSDFDMGMGIGGIDMSNMKGNNPMQMIMTQAMIRGFSNTGSFEVAEMRKELEIMKLQQEHERELEKERSSVSNRIMGLVEENFDSLLDFGADMIPMLGLASKSNKPKQRTIQNEQQDTAQQQSQPVSGAKMPMHQRPSDDKNGLSSDAFLGYAAHFKKKFPDLNPNVVFAKMVMFAEMEPDQARFIFNTLDQKLNEATQDEQDEH